jgi:hypothetical protein
MGEATKPEWRRILFRFMGASIAGHLIWEIAQLPLFTLWTTGTRQQIAFAVVHCTIGDVMIAGVSLITAFALLGHAARQQNWPHFGIRRTWMTILAVGISYTIFSEWLNTGPRQNWAYSDLMPVIPFIGTGLAPLLQWIAIPTLALWNAAGRRPWLR